MRAIAAFPFDSVFLRFLTGRRLGWKSSLTILGGSCVEALAAEGGLITEVDVEASASVEVVREEDEEEEGIVKREISHFAIEPSLLAVKRYLQSSLVTAHVRGSRCTLLLVVAEDAGMYESW